MSITQYISLFKQNNQDKEIIWVKSLEEDLMFFMENLLEDKDNISMDVMVHPHNKKFCGIYDNNTDSKFGLLST